MSRSSAPRPAGSRETPTGDTTWPWAFLWNVGKALRLSRQKINTVLNREKQAYFRFLEPLTDCLNDLDLQRYAVVVGDANYAPALTKFLADDLGWLPELTVCTDPLDDEEKDRLTSQVNVLESRYKTTLVFETDGSRAIEHLQKKWPPAGVEAAGEGGCTRCIRRLWV